MRFFTIAVVSLLMIVPPVCGQQALTANDFLITPGVSIGPLTLEMTITDAVHRLGTPKSTQTYSDQSTRFRWYDYVVSPNGSSNVFPGRGGLYAAANALGRLTRIGVFEDSRYKTPQGLRVGVRDQEIVQAMGTPDYTHNRKGTAPDLWATHEMGYRRAGIAFLVVDLAISPRYGHVDEITIFSKQD